MRSGWPNREKKVAKAVELRDKSFILDIKVKVDKVEDECRDKEDNEIVRIKNCIRRFVLNWNVTYFELWIEFQKYKAITQVKWYYWGILKTFLIF